MLLLEEQIVLPQVACITTTQKNFNIAESHFSWLRITVSPGIHSKVHYKNF